MITNLLLLISSFEDFFISHIFREGNALEDSFVNIGVLRRNDFIWQSNDPPPSNVEDIINYNLLHG